jgi:hypothetical protein
VNQALHLRGLQRQEEGLALQQEKLLLDKEERTEGAKLGKMFAQGGMTEEFQGQMMGYFAKFKPEKFAEMVLNDDAATQQANKLGLPKQYAASLNRPGELSKQLAESEVGRGTAEELRQTATTLGRFAENNAAYTGIYNSVTSHRERVESALNDAVSLQQSIVDKFNGTRPATGGADQARFDDAKRALDQATAAREAGKASLMQSGVEAAESVRQTAETQLQVLDQNPPRNARQYKVMRDLLVYKAAGANAMARYIQDPTDKDKKALFESASRTYDAALEDVQQRGKDAQDQHQDLINAKTQGAVYKLEVEKSIAEGQSLFAALPAERQTPQEAAKIANALTQRGMVRPPTDKIMEAIKNPNRPLTEVNISSGERTETVENRAKLDMVKEVETLFDPSYVGPVDARVSAVKQFFDKLDPNESDFRAKVTLMGAEIRKFFAGTAQSKQELKALSDAIPALDQPDEKFQSSMRTTKQNILNKLEQMKNVQTELGMKSPKFPPPSTKKKSGGWTVEKVEP